MQGGCGAITQNGIHGLIQRFKCGVKDEKGEVQKRHWRKISEVGLLLKIRAPG